MYLKFIVVQLLSHIWLFATPWTAAGQAFLSFFVSWGLLKFMSIESVVPSPSHLLPLPLFAFSLSQHRSLFQWISSSIRWLKHWRFNFNISPPNEYLELISFRIDWFDLFAVQGTLKSLLQHHNSEASILGAQPSLWSNSHIQTWQLEKP